MPYQIIKAYRVAMFGREEYVCIMDRRQWNLWADTVMENLCINGWQEVHSVPA